LARPTINDLALAAGVSVSTVNRVLSGAANVRMPTVELVREAAERIGFYGLGAIRSQMIAKLPKLRFGFLLHQSTRVFYRNMGTALHAEARATQSHDIEPVIVHADDLSPQFLASKLLELGETCQAVAVVAAVHPLLSQAVDALAQRNVPVVALISQLAATGSVSYVGPDNWKAGRTAAWAVANLSKSAGKVGILVGNHRYRGQEMNEAGFRSYFREYAPEFTLLEPLSTFETSAVAEAMTEKLLAENPDMKGLFVAGGGISGAMHALRTSGRAENIITVAHQLMDNTRAGLLDGTVKMVLHDPLDKLAREAFASMIRSCSHAEERGRSTTVLPFEIYTRENI
jgi:LacI family transcriptional regulator